VAGIDTGRLGRRRRHLRAARGEQGNLEQGHSRDVKANSPTERSMHLLVSVGWHAIGRSSVARKTAAERPAAEAGPLRDRQPTRPAGRQRRDRPWRDRRRPREPGRPIPSARSPPPGREPLQSVRVPRARARQTAATGQQVQPGRRAPLVRLAALRPRSRSRRTTRGRTTTRQTTISCNGASVESPGG